MSRPRAFTLLEAMVAASVGLIILLGATNLATMMVRTTRIAGDNQALTTRAQLARGMLQPLLAGIGDGWPVDDAFTSPFTSSTGAPGEAHCAPATNLCTAASPRVFPLTILDGGATGPDALRAIVPRPGAIESVQIQKLAGGIALPTNCTNLPAVPAFDVKGVTSTAWNTGDLVIVSNPKTNRVSVAVVVADFGADTTTPAPTRTLQLNLGPPADLAFDDGGRTPPSSPCSAAASLQGAFVFPASVIDLRLASGAIELAESRTAAQVLDPPFVRALEGIDDLQIRLEIARFPRTGAAGSASLCTSNGPGTLASQPGIFDGGRTFSSVGAGASTCPAAGVLNDNPVVGDVYRITGLELGLLIRGDAIRETAAIAVPGMFNRTGTVATDTFVRHRATFFIGLPNAHAL
jgi:type II secretory pathway pseudopilin PulG